MAKELKLDTNELLEYQEAVNFYAANKKNNVLSNDGDSYAVVIFMNIFKTAEHYIRLLAKNLNNPITKTSEYRDALCSFLEKKDTTLDIILTDYNDTDSLSNTLFDIFRLYKNKVTIKNSDHHGFKMKNQNKPIHFCVADNRMYRLEYDIEKRMARCNFNDPTSANKLATLFDKLFVKETTKKILY